MKNKNKDKINKINKLNIGSVIFYIVANIIYGILSLYIGSPIILSIVGEFTNSLYIFVSVLCIFCNLVVSSLIFID